MRMSSVDSPVNLDMPSYHVSVQKRHLTMRVKGAWTLDHANSLDKKLSDDIDTNGYDSVTYVFDDDVTLDTVGAYILARAIRCGSHNCYDYTLENAGQGKVLLMRAAAEAQMGKVPKTHSAWYDVIARLGRSTQNVFFDTLNTVAFVGQFMTVLGKTLLQPHKMRWASIFTLIEDVGVNAIPIVMTLSFFIGAVIAYMGSTLLATIGFQIFMVELVGFAVLRELAVIITAILLAGRSASAFTAKLGAMKMRQEIDALEVIGLDTFQTLVVPRAIACLIAMPILTFLAMCSGIFGGMLVAWAGPIDISPILFFARFQETISGSQFWVGIVKAPFFALIIAIIGCRHGLSVTGSVDSLGARTTTSVVQSIFAVIMLDALFAMLFLEMGI